MDKERTNYKVKIECFDRFYWGSAGELIEDYQTNGIPKEDLDFLSKEWGESEVMEMLEEI